MNREEHIANIQKMLPDKPGIYQYFDREGKIIYVGKAKSLKKRVASYFNRDSHENNKTSVLVRNITDIKFILVETETDALLLENSLIKKYQPRYNVLLKDDKSYPWICIKNEPFPRVFQTRKLIRDGSSYYGPYTSVKVVQTLLELIKKLYPLRTCSYTLSPENIDARKFKVCLEYHLGNCKAPCIGIQPLEEYNNSINHIREIIKGNLASVNGHLKQQMNEYASRYEFEKAQRIKEKIDVLEKYQSRSTIVSPTIDNVDVFSILSDEDMAFVNYLKVVNGVVVQGHTLELKKKLDEPDEELLELAIVEILDRFKSEVKELVIPFEVNFNLPGVQKVVPQRGDKKKLLELSLRNASYYRKDKQKQSDLVDPERHTKRIMQQMMKDLRLKEEPRHIECFDNSNIQGAYPVAAMTVFRDGRPSKKDYRHFNIKTVEGPNDFASMEEVIYRRYKRMMEEEQAVPQLIVIDGGKGQLSSALTSLERLGLRGKIGIIGIAKKLEEIYYPGDSIPMYLDKTGETLKVIQQIRDEAHRFGITHHRKRREKGTIKSELTEIKGISDTTAQKLLSTFRSVKKVKEAGEMELTAVIGKAKAKLIFDHFNPIQ
jgi:excinuclease ABC subunit C